MPLDGHSYLIAQGWGGKGTGLRQGAISRPLAIPQKKNLAGLGKDRDEAFPFWDHLFSAAAKSIQVKLLSDDEDGNDSDCSAPVDTTSSSTFKRTTTGILSTRRPVEGTPATSGTNTPDVMDQTPQFSLIVTAKREAAKRGLYARFFRGPVLGPDSPFEEKKVAAIAAGAEDIKLDTTVTNLKAGGVEGAKKRKQESEEEDGERERKKRNKGKKKEKREIKEAEKVDIQKKRKSKGKEKERGEAVDDGSADKAERRRLRRELKEAKKKSQIGIEAGQPYSESMDRARRKEKKKLKNKPKLEGTRITAQALVVEGGMGSSRTLNAGEENPDSFKKKKRRHRETP